MSEPAHLTHQQLVDYLQRKSSAAELLAVDDHLAACESCRSQAMTHAGMNAALPDVATLFAEESEAAHLEYRELERLADGTLDGVDLEMSQSHLAECANCRAELDDLQRFRNSLTTRPAPRPSRTLQWLVAASLAAAVLLATYWYARHQATSPTLSPPTTPSAQVVSTVLLIDEGGPIERTADGSLRGVDVRWLKEVDATLRDPQLSPPSSLHDLHPAAPVFRGEDPKQSSGRVRLLSPVGIMLDEQTPTLSWKANDLRCRAMVLDETFATIAQSDWTREGETKIDRELPRGKSYSWQLHCRDGEREVIAPSGSEAEARFAILSSEAHEQLNAARGSHSHLIRATEFARAGLLREARAELEELRKLNPSSPLVQQLMKSLPAD